MIPNVINVPKTKQVESLKNILIQLILLVALIVRVGTKLSEFVVHICNSVLYVSSGFTYFDFFDEVSNLPGRRSIGLYFWRKCWQWLPCSRPAFIVAHIKSRSYTSIAHMMPMHLFNTREAQP